MLSNNSFYSSTPSQGSYYDPIRSYYKTTFHSWSSKELFLKHLDQNTLHNERNFTRFLEMLLFYHTHLTFLYILK